MNFAAVPVESGFRGLLRAAEARLVAFAAQLSRRRCHGFGNCALGL